MLSHITFLLSLALVASSTNPLIGQWSYEGQFVVGNPTTNWEMAGYKMIMDVIIDPVKPHSSDIYIQFVNPIILTLNDRVPEKTAWSQLNRMSWSKSDLSLLKMPFAVNFKEQKAESIVFSKSESKTSMKIKEAFALNLESALKDSLKSNWCFNIKNEQTVKDVMGRCNITTSMKNTTQLKDGQPLIKQIKTIYQYCDNSRHPIVGVIPKIPACVSCESYPWKMPLDSYKKTELGFNNRKLENLLIQEVVVLPIYEADAPQYSIHSNTSLIFKNVLKAGIVVEDLQKKEKTCKIQMNETREHIPGIYQVEFFQMSKIVKEAVRMIHAIISVRGHLKVGDNINALYDLLVEYPLAIPQIEAALTTSDEWKVFYSFLMTQESPKALETLMKAVLIHRIPLPTVPAMMILSAKVTALKNVSEICAFINSIKVACPLCADVSYLAMSIIMRRNNMKDLKCAPVDKRVLLAVAGNAEISLKVPTTDVLLRLAYVQSKRNIRSHEVHRELIDIIMSPKEELIVRTTAFKLLISQTCEKVILSSLFSRLNEINDEALLNFMITHLETLASIKVPVYKYVSQIVQEWLPVLKVQKSLCQAARSFGLSTYNPKTNMGVAVFVDYAIPRQPWETYATVSLEIQPYIMNSLLSAIKIQIALPKKELMAIVEIIRSWRAKVVPIKVILSKLIPHLKHIAEKMDVSIYNDDLEIITISGHKKICSWMNSLVKLLRESTAIRGAAVPFVVKKTIPSILGPKIIMSVISYVSIDTAYEILTAPKLGFTVTPRLTAGMRLKLQATNKISTDIGTQVNAVFETNKIQVNIEKEQDTYRLVTFMPIQTTPVLSLRVIPSTDLELASPRRTWQEQTTPFAWAKVFPVNWVLSLDQPAIAINVTGVVAKSVTEKWLFALQSPQILQVYILPTYKLPSDIIVIEWVYSRSKCPTTKYCSWRSAADMVKPRWCQKLCINSWDSYDNTKREGAAIAIVQEASRLTVDSKIKVTGTNRYVFTASIKWNYPALVEPLDLFKKEYINMLKKHQFDPLPTMQITPRETEITRTLQKVRDVLFYVESRQQDYSDLFMDIMLLYPELYFRDTLKIPGLHETMKKVILLSTMSLQARSQIYVPPWKELEVVKTTLLTILKTPLKKSAPEVMIMQDHVILWCVTKYFEIAHDYFHACGKCAKGLAVITEYKTILFKAWNTFYTQSKKVVKDVLPSTEGLDVLKEQIFNIDDTLIKLIGYSGKDPVKHMYKTLRESLRLIQGKLQELQWKEKVMAARTYFVKLVGFELLKTNGDHWLFTEREHRMLKLRSGTDLGISFLSTSSMVYMQAINLLAGKTEVEADKVDILVNQAVQLIDYRRWLRMAFLDGSEIPNLQDSATKLLKNTDRSLDILSRLPSNLTMDPMWNLFVTGLMAVQRSTIVELRDVPKYALQEDTKVNFVETEWKFVKVWKTLFRSNRPLDTLKRGILKSTPVLTDSSSRPFDNVTVTNPVNVEVSIQWTDVRVNMTFSARKSDSQVIKELQETTMSKSWAMVVYLQEHMKGSPHLWLDPYVWELNMYKDVAGWMTVEGHLPESVKSRIGKSLETYKTLVLPYETTLSAEENQILKSYCKSDVCLRAVLSRDNQKVDLLWVDPQEIMALFQLPTAL